MKYYLTLLLSVFCTIAFSQTQNAINKFASTAGFENASLGFCVKDMNGKEIASYNKNMSLTPASTLKVLTSATALETFGSQYAFETTLAIDSNNPNRLIVHGYGDPTLGSEYLYNQPRAFLNEWIAQIKKQFSTDQPIEILVIDDYFGYSGVSSKWLQEDLGNYFAAGAYGISVFDNTYRLYLNTMDTESTPSILKTVPDMPNLIFDNTMGVNYENKDNGYINGETLSNYRSLVGDIPANRKSFVIKGDIPDPGLMLGNTLAESLNTAGYKVATVNTSRKDYYQKMFNQWTSQTDYQEKIFYTHRSPSLEQIVRVVNERSNNHYTEHLVRAVGRTNNRSLYPDALKEGILNTIAFWNSKGINTNSLKMYDGCGLAPSNAISSEMLSDVLIYMNTKSLYADAFYKSLPQAGKEGTVRNVLKGSRLEGKVVMKSGSIANVQCFAGYYFDGAKKYAFSVMVNNYNNSSRREVVRAIENLLSETLL